MEYVPGKSIDYLLQTFGPFNIRTIRKKRKGQEGRDCGKRWITNGEEARNIFPAPSALLFLMHCVSLRPPLPFWFFFAGSPPFFLIFRLHPLSFFAFFFRFATAFSILIHFPFVSPFLFCFFIFLSQACTPGSCSLLLPICMNTTSSIETSKARTFSWTLPATWNSVILDPQNDLKV